MFAGILVSSVFLRVYRDCFHDPRLDSGLEAQGGRVAVVDDTASVAFGGPYSVALWVMPGEEQDRLEALPQGIGDFPNGAQGSRLGLGLAFGLGYGPALLGRPYWYRNPRGFQEVRPVLG